ncbi:MAG: molecular chaperone Hsp90 [Actinomycetes bacterium]
MSFEGRVDQPGVDQPRVDPFGTTALRTAVLDGWTASPTRFREDANVEDDFARDGYRNQLLVELAQNAADAASAAEVDGRLLLRLTDDVLVAANTGRPLDAAGVQALASMRASAKREGSTTGRFGVGFAAVLSVTDAPVVYSHHGGVTFSAAATRAAVSAVPHLSDELSRRTGHVPVLRLPFAVDPSDPAAPEIPDGYDTVVVLPLRDGGGAYVSVAALVEGLDAALLLALPALSEIVVEWEGRRRVLRSSRSADASGETVRVHDDGVASTWVTASRSGALDPGLLADRPVEERQRPDWSVLWAVPVDDDGPTPWPDGVPAVLHAPTRSDEPLALPALLIATFPMEPNRRHVAAGGLAQWLAEQAASVYADLVVRVAAAHGAAALRLVPTGPGVGALDATIRADVLTALRDRPLVPLADDPGHRVVAREAARLEPSDANLTRTVADALAGLADPKWSERAAMSALGSPVLPLSDVLDALASLRRPATWWRDLYEALDAAHVDRSLLDGLPVPLVDGRMWRGVRGLVVPERHHDGANGAVDVAVAEAAELPMVDPEAAHPLLLRLGAQSADPLVLLQASSLLGAVERSADAEDPEPLAAAVLGLAAAAAGAVLDDRLELLALPASDGTWQQARHLVLPGSPLADVLDEPLVVSATWVERFGEEALRAVGVMSNFRLRRHVDVPLDAETVGDLVADGDAWVDWVLELVPPGDYPPLVPELVVVERLDEVRGDAWTAALAMLAQPELRAAVVDPVRILLADGRGVDVVSPSAWWLRDAPLFDGAAPVDLRLPGSDLRLVGLFDDAPAAVAQVDAGVLSALGLRRDLAELLAETDGPEELVERLGDPRRQVDADSLNAIYASLVALPGSRWPAPAARVRVPDGPGSRVVDADDVTVVVSPMHRPLVDGPVLPGDARLAELLDLDSSESLADSVIASSGVRRSLDESVVQLLSSELSTWWEHDDLVVDDHHLDAWVDASGAVHAATVEGLALALCWASSQWSLRHEVAAVLADPTHAAELLAQRAYDSWADAGPVDGPVDGADAVPADVPVDDEARR